MGEGNTKLLEIEELKKSVRSQANRIESLQGQSLIDLSASNRERVCEELWKMIAGLKVSKAEARIVANSKVLHHIIPIMMPPIDRTYTYKFFFDRTMLSIPEEEAFFEIFEGFHAIALARKDEIMSLVGNGWNTSETKIIDNTIVGYIKERQKEEKARGTKKPSEKGMNNE